MTTITTELAQRMREAAENNFAPLLSIPNKDVLALLGRIVELEELATDYGMKFQRAQDALKHVSIMHRGEARTEQQPVPYSQEQRDKMKAIIVNKLAGNMRGHQLIMDDVHAVTMALMEAGFRVSPADPAPVTVKLPDSGLGEFERGVFYSAYLVCELHDDPTIAADVLREANLDGSDVSSLDDCEKEVLLKLNASEKISLTAAGIKIAEGD